MSLKKVIFTILCLSFCIFSFSSDYFSFTWLSPDRSSSRYRDMAEFPSYREIQEIFNCKIDFNHSRLGEYNEKVKLMLSSKQDLPDVISYDFMWKYPGGILKAIDDGVVLPISDRLQQFAPNLVAFLEHHPEIKSEISLPDGSLFCFPSLSPDSEVRTYIGPFVVREVFEASGMDLPQTMDEWYLFLRKIKDENLADIPLSFYGGKIKDTNVFIGAYGIGWGFFLDGEVIRFGEASQEFFLFLSEFSRWISEGLVDPLFSVQSLKAYRSRACRKKVGVLVDYVSSIEKIAVRRAPDLASDYFVPMRYPSLRRGEKVEFGHRMPVFSSYLSAYLTPSCDNLEKVIEVLDYAYSPDGFRLFNFGIQGESYFLNGGKAVFSDNILNSPKGFATAVADYVAAGPYVKSKEAFFQGLRSPVQRQAIDLWSDTNADSHLIPILHFNENEREIIFKKMTLINGYLDKVIFDFLFKGVSKDEFDLYIRNLEELGIRDVEKIYNDAYL
ncbi:MAG: hypothetical protein JXR63_02695, partial [Spirochaetales bacterium]|nr:hypothetical protein [Spirochaetales bacterium]